MSNAKNESKNNNQDSILTSLGCLFFIGFIAIFILLSSYHHNLTPEEIQQEKAEKKAEFVKFDNQLFAATSTCDIKFAEAQRLLTKDTVKAASVFDEAHYACLDSFNNVQKIEIPDLIGYDQQDLLKKAMEDITTAYASKRGASESAYKFLTSGDISKINKAKEEIELAQENLAKGKSKIKEVKIEVGILPKNNKTEK